MDFDFDTMFENSRSLKSNKAEASSTSSDLFYERTKEELEKHRSDKKARRERFLQMMSQPPKPEKPIIDDYIADGKQVFQQLFLRVNKISEDFTDNVDLKPVPKGLKATKDDKWDHVELIRDLFDEDTELEESQLKNKRLDKVSKIQQVIKNLELRSAQTSNQQELTDFSLYKEEFFRKFNGWKFEKLRLQQFQQYKAFDPTQKFFEISKILNYQEKDVDKINNLYVTYITSGGGKTAFYKRYKSYLNLLDVDEFIKLNYESFSKFKEFEKFLGDDHEGIMTLWFKYKLDEMFKRNELDNVVLLFNHPNQLPNYFRRKYNEIIIMPEKLNWEVRFFKENYFSLACVLGKHKVVLSYDKYLSYILEFFQVWFSPTLIRKLLKKQIYGLKPFNSKNLSDSPTSSSSLHHSTSSSANKRVNSWVDDQFDQSVIPKETGKKSKYRKK